MKDFEMPKIVLNQEAQKTETYREEVSIEQNEIIESVEKFSEYLISRFPQIDANRRMIIAVDEEGTTIELPEFPESIQTELMMNYYLSGSLATMLLSRAEQFIEIEENQIPMVREGKTCTIPERSRQILATFTRLMGDLDYVSTDFYNGKKAHVQKSFRRVGDEEYQQMRGKFLWKGGGPKIEEIPEKAAKCLKQQGEKSLRVMVDPVESYGARRVAKIVVAGKEYFIARPDTIFSYKVLHLLQGYEQKPERFNVDFGKLFSAMKEMYSEEELLQITTQILNDYENAMEALYCRSHEEDESKPYDPKIPSFIKNVLGNQSITQEIRSFIESIQREFVVEKQNL